MILLDTDIDTDCDDAGALAVVHALVARGECELAGVVCCVPIAACAGAVRTINCACKRADVPVGTICDPHYDVAPRWELYRRHRARLSSGAFGDFHLYNERLAAMRSAHDPPPEDAVAMYRRVLAQALLRERSVTICAIGTLTALAALLESDPDEHSPLHGRALVAATVAELVTMASADGPTGCDGFNWRMDSTAAAAVIAGWPTPVTISATGTDVLTGARLTTDPVVPTNHPVRIAYETFLGGAGRDRPSWDQLAVLYAVRGARTGEFVRSPAMSLLVDPATGEHRWSDPRPNTSPRHHVRPVAPASALATQVEDLMIEAACG